jgi:hypothetical protein
MGLVKSVPVSFQLEKNHRESPGKGEIGTEEPKRKNSRTVFL